MPVIVTSAESSRWRAALIAAAVSLAAWLSSGSIGFRSAAGDRIGALPVDLAAAILILVVGVLAFAVARRNTTRAAIAIAPLVLIVAPWVPGPLPAAVLIWTGALTGPIWIAVAIGLASIVARMPPSRVAMSPRGHLAGAALAGCVVFGAAAWSASASIPGGDEPHYLVITQSILSGHGLNVASTYARGAYREYYGGPLNPDFRVFGRHGEIYSIHAPGVPILVLPAFALAGYRGAVAFLILLAAAGCTLAWWLAWRTTGSVFGAWFGWAAVALSGPFLLESFTVYPDVPGAVAVLTGFWALLRLDWKERVGPAGWMLHGAALAILPWMHARFALLAIVLGAFVTVRLIRTPGGLRNVPAFLAVPAVSAIGWLVAFHVMYGSWNPAASYGDATESALAFLPNGIGGLLFDQGFGALATAPVLAVALAGLARVRRYAVAFGLTAIVYGAAVGTYAMWWAGTSGPARLLVALMLPLAIPAACAWTAWRSRGARAVMLAALVATVWVSGIAVGGAGGVLGYHGRNVAGATAAPWFEWANHALSLPDALPGFVPLPEGTPVEGRMAAARAGFAAALPWIVCLWAAGVLIVRVGRTRAKRQTLIAAGAVAFAVATMVAASVVWWMRGVRPLTVVPAQFDLLRQFAQGRTLAIDISRGHPVSHVADLRMQVDIPVTPDDQSPATLAAIPWFPAGSFEISTRGTLRAPARLVVGRPDEPYALLTADPVSLARGVTVPLPVDVRRLTLQAATSSAVSAIEIKPVAIQTAVSDRPARVAATYGRTSVFFLDDRTEPEADGFWIWGAREGEVVFEPTIAPLSVVLRNGAVPNDVTIRAGAWAQHLSLGPGEEHPITLPSSGTGRPYVTSIVTATGFRPADVDPRSQDRRFLGVYVVMPDHAAR